MITAIERLKNERQKITPTVIAAKAVAKAMEACPILNSVIRFGRAYQ